MSVEFDDCEGIAETSLAVLVRIPDADDREIWIPLNQISDDSEVYKNDTTGRLIISDWIAKKKGLA